MHDRNVSLTDPVLLNRLIDHNVATLSLVGLAVTLLSANPGLAWRRVLMRACGLAEGRGEGGPDLQD